MRTAPILTLVLSGIQRLVNLAVTFIILGSLALFALHFLQVPALQHWGPVTFLHRYFDPVFLRLGILTHLTSLATYMPLLLVVLMIIISAVLERIFQALYAVINVLGAREAKAARAAAAAKAAAPPTAVDSEAARAHLYKEYRKIEQQLKGAQRRQCTFLSIDVVGSTGMKSGETEIAITSTFRAYEELLRRTFQATKSWKESWTPDGVMICYQNREQAVEAAKTILTKLLAFNEKGNMLKTAFNVRCGINEGEVVVFDDSDVEKLVEHVIDVAGHMQKYAKPGSLLLSKELYEVLEDHAGFSPTDVEVDGYKTYSWAPQ